MSLVIIQSDKPKQRLKRIESRHLLIKKILKRMKNLLVLFLIGIAITCFGQARPKKMGKDMEAATSAERFFVCYTMENAQGVCETVNTCPGNQFTPEGASVAYQVTSCTKVKPSTTSILAERGLKNPKSVGVAVNSKMVHCKQLLNGSYVDCFEEIGTCSSVKWKKGYVCKDLKAEKAQGKLNNQN